MILHFPLALCFHLFALMTLEVHTYNVLRIDTGNERPLCKKRSISITNAYFSTYYI